MTISRSAAALTIAGVLLVTVTSCANDGKDRAAGGNPTPTTSSAASSTVATPDSETVIASEKASEVVRRYFSTVDQLRQEPSRPVKELRQVAISSQLAAQRTLIHAQRRDGLRQVGSTTVAELVVQSVNMDNSDPNSGRVPTVEIDVCYDVSDVDILDQDGQSTVSLERPATGWVRFSVSNYAWSTDPQGAWRVASGADLKQAPCVPS